MARAAAVGFVPSDQLRLEVLLIACEFHPGILPMELHELLATLVGKRRA